MIDAYPQRQERPRPTIKRLMVLVLVAGLVFGAAAALRRDWPFSRWLGGTANLGMLLVILYLPILPAMLIWQSKAARQSSDKQRRAVFWLLLSFVGWIAAVYVTFRSALRSIGL
jgi:hypothetical protein